MSVPEGSERGPFDEAEESDPLRRSTRSRMRAVKNLGPLTAYAVYVFVGGSQKGSAPPGGVSDKVAHFIAFGLMVPLAVLAVRYLLPRLSSVARMAVAIGVCSALGALLELWQLLLPWRSAELLDWGADTAGALVVGALGLLVARMRERIPSGSLRG